MSVTKLATRHLASLLISNAARPEVPSLYSNHEIRNRTVAGGGKEGATLDKQHQGVRRRFGGQQVGVLSWQMKGDDAALAIDKGFAAADDPFDDKKNVIGGLALVGSHFVAAKPHRAAPKRKNAALHRVLVFIACRHWFQQQQAERNAIE